MNLALENEPFILATNPFLFRRRRRCKASAAHHGTSHSYRRTVRLSRPSEVESTCLRGPKHGFHTGSCKFARFVGFFRARNSLLTRIVLWAGNMAGSFEVLLSSLLSTESSIRVQAEVKLELEGSFRIIPSA